MAVITMSERKLGRLRVLIDVADGKLSVTDPESLLGLRRRQIFRLLAMLRDCGFRQIGPRRTVRGSSLAAAE